ncbi:MAG: glycosyltransferase [Acidimicrobiales bacterium]
MDVVRTSSARPATADATTPAAPPVVAVVVTHNPGRWFADSLAALAAQDYPALETLVIDAASDSDVAGAVAKILPRAHVKRIDANPGFGAAANAAIPIVKGAAFYLLCHDDVALSTDAVRVMVEEAFKSNAGVVGPKLVRWDEPRQLAAVGLAVDKTGVPSPLVEPGELDQAQHDVVRDVFAVPGGCMLVRADLFTALEGFDPAIPYLGEDLDLCWRAKVAGARILVAPGAVARHAEAQGERRKVDDRRRLEARHRLRTMLTCYSGAHLLRVLPQAAVIAIGEAVYGVLTGGFRRAFDVLGAWVWNVAHLPGTLRQRRLVQSQRRTEDRDLRKLQVRGSAGLGAIAARGVGAASTRSVAGASRDLLESLQHARVRSAVGVWVAVLAVVLIGSRLLIANSVPAFGDLPALPESPRELFAQWVSSWRSVGLGSDAPAPTGLGLLGLGGLATFAQTGLLRMLLVVGVLVTGLIGAWRLTKPLPSNRARAVGLIIYTAIPVPYNAIATGRWGGLVVWAATPFLLARLARATGRAPYGRRAGRRYEVLALGLLTALVAAFVPFVVAVLLLMAVGLVAGTVLVGTGRGSGRVLVDAMVAAAIGAVLHLPWTIGLVRGFDWQPIGGVASGESLDWLQLLSFQSGPYGGVPFGLAFLVVAALPLLIGRGWRLAWASRGWAVALACWAVAWSGGQSWFPVNLSAPEALLAPAAMGLALAAAIGPVAFEVDLPDYHFGWRQIATGLAAVAGVVGLVPLAVGVVNGRWGAPPEGFDSLLSFLDEQQEEGAFRVLWLGDADVLPVAGRDVRPGVAYGTSDEGLPEVADRWLAAPAGPTDLIAQAVDVAEARQTSRLGRLLGPMGIRYVIVPEVPAPGLDDERHPQPELVGVLSEQLDLVRLDVDPEIHVFRNDAWTPERAALPAGVLAPVTGVTEADAIETANAIPLTGGTPVLTDRSTYATYHGEVLVGDVFLGAASSENWRLEVGDEATRADRTTVYGWANGFTVGAAGEATLRYETPTLDRVLLGVQVVLGLAAIGVLRTAAIRRRRAEEAGGSP